MQMSSTYRAELIDRLEEAKKAVDHILAINGSIVDVTETDPGFVSVTQGYLSRLNQYLNVLKNPGNIETSYFGNARRPPYRTNYGQRVCVDHTPEVFVGGGYRIVFCEVCKIMLEKEEVSDG